MDKYDIDEGCVHWGDIVEVVKPASADDTDEHYAVVRGGSR